MGTGGSSDRNGRNGRNRTNDTDKSPFFAPATPRVIAETPGGTKRAVKQRDGVKERKSTIVGATANLINAIVGSGIVGIPFAIQQAGLVAGIGLVCLCAVLTDKSLRLLVETAKHASAPSYETTMEAAFGRRGFLFVCINMFIMSYGAMVSYLMIVKDTLPYVLGVTDLGMRRALLCLISLAVMVPLSAQRDVANLAKTSRISVVLDICMVALVAYIATHFRDTRRARRNRTCPANLNLEVGYCLCRSWSSQLRVCLSTFSVHHCRFTRTTHQIEMVNSHHESTLAVRLFGKFMRYCWILGIHGKHRRKHSEQSTSRSIPSESSPRTSRGYYAFRLSHGIICGTSRMRRYSL